MKENIEECRQKRKKVVVLDAPLLFEAGLERICTVTWRCSPLGNSAFSG